MIVSKSVSTGRRIRRGLLLPAAVALAVAVLGAEGGAGATATHVVELGKTVRPPKPSCPAPPGTSNCQSVGKVTGFQRLVATPRGTVRPFNATFSGRIVAWSVTTSVPAKPERKFFNDFYGAPSKARLAVLRKIKGKSPPRYRLLRQSPMVQMSPYFGEKTIFSLRKPLYLQKDQIVALTVPTWLPAFAINLSDKNAWRGSRRAGRCASSDQVKNAALIKAGHPQMKVGTARQYGCTYRTARLLYTAYVATKQ